MRRLVPSRLVSMLFALVIVHPNPGKAEGALAIGQPPNIVKDGFAYGASWNYATKEEAAKNAMERCRQTKSELRRSLCKIIRPFSNACVAVAMDPKDGTPGVGWAVEPTKEKAEAAAIAECRVTAGRDRQNFCKISEPSGCDTNSK